MNYTYLHLVKMLPVPVYGFIEDDIAPSDGALEDYAFKGPAAAQRDIRLAVSKGAAAEIDHHPALIQNNGSDYRFHSPIMAVQGFAFAFIVAQTVGTGEARRHLDLKHEKNRP